MFRFVRAPEKKKDSIIAIGDIQMIVTNSTMGFVISVLLVELVRKLHCYIVMEFLFVAET